jgi:hypothetical protein
LTFSGDLGHLVGVTSDAKKKPLTTRIRLTGTRSAAPENELFPIPSSRALFEIRTASRRILSTMTRAFFPTLLTALLAACSSTYAPSPFDAGSVSTPTSTSTSTAPPPLDPPDASSLPRDAAVEADAAKAPDPCLPSNPDPLLLADSVAGFREWQGECGWSYGTADTSTRVFKPFAVADTVRHIWVDPGNTFPQIAAASAHPAQGLRVVRRWVATVTGRLRVQVKLALGDPTANAIGGDGVDFVLSVGSTVIPTSPSVITGAQQLMVDVNIDPSKDQPVDFAVGSNGTANYDSVVFSATISRVVP